MARPLNSVNQLHDCHDRQTHFDLAMSGLQLFEDMTHVVPTPLTGDDYSGVEH
jgi:hypothetical protein